MKAQRSDTARFEIAVSHSIRTLALSLVLLLGACGGGGGGGGGSVPAAVQTQPQPAANAFTTTSDSYGMDGASYLASSKSALGIVLRAAIASSMTDQNFKTVTRIDIATPGAITAAGVYSLGPATAGPPAFPGNVYFFNGHQSTLLRTIGGSITFKTYGSNSGDRISGSFSAIVEDGNDTATPKGSYTIAADFDFVTDSYGPVLPAKPSVASAALASYDQNCAACHALGSLDQSATSAPDLALKGGRMNGIFTPEQVGHQGLRLAAGEINALKVLLNIN